MAKTARKNRARNARRAKRALAAAMRGEGTTTRRNTEVVAMFHRYQNTQLCMGDARKRASKRACRGKVRYD